MNEFWWNATYVPKYLWRDELPFSKYMFDNVLRYSYLHRVVEWHIGVRNSWSVNTGSYGKWFKLYLDGETWAQLEATYAGANIEENWRAFFRAVELFRRLATAVGTKLGYKYPADLDKEVTEYLYNIRNMKTTDDAK